MYTKTPSYITPTITGTTITSESSHIWTTVTTMTPEKTDLPLTWEVIHRFLEYDDNELLVEELVGKKEQLYVKITDDDLHMTITFEELNEKFYICLFDSADTTGDMPYIMRAVHLEDLLTKDDAFNIETCQLLSRLKIFESVFA